MIAENHGNDPSQLSIGDTAAQWLELFDSYNFISMQADGETDTTVRETLEESADAAGVQMEIYEKYEPATTEELRVIAEHVPALSPAAVHQAIERKRRLLTKMRDDSSFHRGPVRPETLQLELDALPPPVYEPGYPREIVDVARYVLASQFGAVVVEAAPAAAPPDSDPVSQPGEPDGAGGGFTPPVEENGENGEGLRPPLDLMYYPTDKVIVFPDGRHVFLHRHLEANANTAAQEDRIAALRLVVLRHINDLTDKKSATAIWRDCAPDMTYSAHAWDNYVGDFLTQLEYDGGKLAVMTKPSPGAKRRYYSPGDFAITIHESDEASAFEDTEYFVLPDGSLLSPREARLMHLLVKSSAENPLTKEQFDTSGILSEADLKALQSPEHAFSGVVSALRAKLRAHGGDQAYVIHTAPNPHNRSSANRPVPDYWLERIQVDAEQAARDRMVRDVARLFSEHADAVDEVTAAGPDREKIAALVARYADSSPEPADVEAMLESLQELINPAHTEAIMNALAEDDDPAFELLTTIFAFQSDPSLITQLRQRLEISDDAPVEPLTPADERRLANEFFTEQVTTGVIAEYVKATVTKLKQLGWLNEGSLPSAHSIREEFGAGLRRNDEITAKNIVFREVSKRPEFRALDEQRPGHRPMRDGILASRIMEVLEEIAKENS